jgi:hypothetical protein
MTKIFFTILSGAVFMFAAADARPTPPTIESGQLLSQKERNKCAVPEFLVNIPPVMEKDYIECVNKRSWPSKKLVETVLKQKVDSKAELVSIYPAMKFHSRVYEIKYRVGKEDKSMVCNHTVTYCVPNNPIVDRELTRSSK